MIKNILLMSLFYLCFCSSVFAESWLCSGFFISPNGYLGTAAHCTEQNAKYTVIVNHKKYDANVIGVDKQNDVAILKIDAITDYYTINPMQQLEKTIYVLGYPLPEEKGFNLKISKGFYLFTKEPFLVTTAYTCEGNSGGPTVNANNDLIGVLTVGFGSSPCSIMTGSVKSIYLIQLALKYHVPFLTTFNIVPHISITDSIYNKDLDKTPIVFGEN